MRRRKEKVTIEFDIEYDEVNFDGAWIPKTLYKYRDWGNVDHRKIIEDCAIWIPDSFDFNDPFDCNIPVAYHLLLTDDNMAEAYLRKLLSSRKDSIPDFEMEIKRGVQNMKNKGVESISEYKNQLLHTHKSASGIFSVTPINDNILMWSHYANSHKGVCIGFDSVKLFNCLRGGGGKIHYDKDYPVISPTASYEEKYNYQMFTKSHHWAYEIEYRLTTFKKTNIAISIPKEVITEMIFGTNTSKEHKDDIKEVLRKNLPHVRCYSSVVDDNSFKLNIIEEKL